MFPARAAHPAEFQPYCADRARLHRMTRSRKSGLDARGDRTSGTVVHKFTAGRPISVLASPISRPSGDLFLPLNLEPLRIEMFSQHSHIGIGGGVEVVQYKGKY